MFYCGPAVTDFLRGWEEVVPIFWDILICCRESWDRYLLTYYTCQTAIDPTYQRYRFVVIYNARYISNPCSLWFLQKWLRSKSSSDPTEMHYWVQALALKLPLCLFWHSSVLYCGLESSHGVIEILTVWIGRTASTYGLDNTEICKIFLFSLILYVKCCVFAIKVKILWYLELVWWPWVLWCTYCLCAASSSSLIGIFILAPCTAGNLQGYPLHINRASPSRRAECRGCHLLDPRSDENGRGAHIDGVKGRLRQQNTCGAQSRKFRALWWRAPEVAGDNFYQ